MSVIIDVSFSLREKVPAEQGDEGLTFAIRTSSVGFADTFSLKEKEATACYVIFYFDQECQLFPIGKKQI